MKNITSEENHLLPSEENKKRRFRWWWFFYYPLKYTIRLCIFLAAVALFGLLCIWTALQFSSVQTQATDYLAKETTKLLGFDVTIRETNINWFDKAYFYDVLIRDKQADTLIYAHFVEADISYWDMIQPNLIVIDEATVTDAFVNLKIDTAGDLNIDAFIKRINELTASKKPRDSTFRYTVFTILQSHLKNTRFRFFDERQKKVYQEGFDHYHFDFTQINADLTDLRIVADTIDMQINDLTSLHPNSGLEVKKLSSFFRFCDAQLALLGLNAQVNESVIKDTIIFDYKTIKDLNDFNEKVNLTLHLDSTSLRFAELAAFAPQLKQFQETVRLSGTLKGKVSDFYANHFYVQIGKKSHIIGNISMKGLPDFFNTSIQADIKKAYIDNQDVKQYVPKSAFPTVQKINQVNFTGNFSGFPLDFVAYGKFQTGLGLLDSDLRLVIKNNIDESFYRGRLKTTQFELGKLADNRKLLQRLDMEGFIDGVGFSPEKAAARLKANIKRIGINGYDYKNIKTNALFSANLFDGFMSIQDSNLMADITGQINFHDTVQLIDARANIKRANLDTLGFSQDLSYLSTVFDVKIQYFDLEKIEGTGKFQNNFFVLKGQEFKPQNISFSSNRLQDKRNVVLNTDYLDFKAEGNFKFKDVIEDLSRLAKEYQAIFEGNAAQSEKNYQQKKQNVGVHDYYIDYDLHLKNINEITKRYIPDFYLSPFTHAEGFFKQSPTIALFELDSKIDSLKLNGHSFYKAEVDIKSSKNVYDNDVIAALYVFSQQQKIKGIAPTQHLVFDATWNDGKIEFKTGILQQQVNNHINLIGALKFLKGKYEVNIKQADIHIFEQNWNIPEDNLITVFDKYNISVRNLAFQHKNQFVRLNGVANQSPKDTLTIAIRNFDLASVANVIQTDLKGSLDGKIYLQNVFDSLTTEGELQANDVRWNDFLIGTLKGKLQWEEDKKRMKINVQALRENIRSFDLSGYYYTSRKTEQLAMRINCNGLRLSLFEPFLTDILSNIQGELFGGLDVKGTLTAPILKGKLYANKAKFKVDYTQANYRFDDTIYVEKNGFIIRNGRLLDVNNEVAQLQEGGIYHQNFSNWNIDLPFSFTNFQVLNTIDQDNAIFYGVGYASGTFRMHGSFDNLNFDANIKTEKETSLHIPVDFGEQVGKQHFINYKSKLKEYEKQKAGAEKETNKEVSLSGFNMNFNIEATPDAYIEVIFDKKAGDILRGYGSGAIKMTLDTRGDFNIFGKYIMEKGQYTFTLKNLLVKEFKLEQGSNITFNGELLDGLLDVKANYRQNLSLLPIAADTSRAFTSRPEVRHRYPTNVAMTLKGKLLAPEISYQIKISDYPSILATDVTRFESYLQEDEQELNRQVFSVLVLSQLSPIGRFSGSLNSGVNSVSEMLSSQLGNWFSQVDENLEVNINLGGFDKEALNIMQLRLSYTLLDGRLRITRDGQFTNAYNQANANTIAGDITVEYMITQDGKLRLKMFRRNNQNLLTTALPNINTTTSGFSVMYTTSFDNLSELIKRKKKQEESSDTNSLEQQPIMYKEEEEE